MCSNMNAFLYKGFLIYLLEEWIFLDFSSFLKNLNNFKFAK